MFMKVVETRSLSLRLHTFSVLEENETFSVHIFYAGEDTYTPPRFHDSWVKW